MGLFTKIEDWVDRKFLDGKVSQVEQNHADLKDRLSSINDNMVDKSLQTLIDDLKLRRNGHG